jgi:tetratricopeptide (TPR) repeat protein
MDGHESLSKLFETILAGLEDEARRVFLSFGVFASPSISTHILAEYFPDMFPETIKGYLQTLFRRYLVWPDINCANVFRMHALALIYARHVAELDTPGVIRAVRRSVQKWAERANSRVHDTDVFEELDCEIPYILNAVRLAIKSSPDDLSAIFVPPLRAGYFESRGYNDTVINLLKDASDILNSDVDRDLILGKLGNALRSRGLWYDAIADYESAISIARRLGNGTRVVQLSGYICMIYLKLGQKERAEQILNDLPDLNTPEARLEQLSAWGYYASTEGDFQAAARFFEEALKVTQAIEPHSPKYRESKFQSYNNLADTYLRMGQYATAVMYGQDALSWASSPPVEQFQGFAHHTLGEIYCRSGDTEKAKFHFAQARAHYEKCCPEPLKSLPEDCVA